jgi:DNA polymerase-3 subunit epsilon
MIRYPYFFDLETTGIDPFRDLPVQVGLTLNGRILMNSLCNPYMPIPEGATKIHGITDQMVQGHPDHLYVLWTMLKLLPPPDQMILCGFNQTTYDSVMVDACMAVEDNKPEDYSIQGKYDQLDVLDLLYRYEPTLPSKKLTAAYRTLTGKELTGAHGAVADCLGTEKLLTALCVKYGKIPEQFMEELKVPKRYEIMPIGKNTLGKKVSEVPRGWAQWMRNNADRMRPDLQLTIDWILDQR